MNVGVNPSERRTASGDVHNNKHCHFPKPEGQAARIPANFLLADLALSHALSSTPSARSGPARDLLPGSSYTWVKLG